MLKKGRVLLKHFRNPWLKKPWFKFIYSTKQHWCSFPTIVVNSRNESAHEIWVRPHTQDETRIFHTETATHESFTHAGNITLAQ